MGTTHRFASLHKELKRGAQRKAARPGQHKHRTAQHAWRLRDNTFEHETLPEKCPKTEKSTVSIPTIAPRERGETGQNR